LLAFLFRLRRQKGGWGFSIPAPALAWKMPND
jgi:hypothetical protein